MAALKEFTKEEVAVHNKADDVWMIIENYVRMRRAVDSFRLI